ncbi:MAG: efflux RND transporter periplasmic adaptor subunit, partial [Longimicrobiales bacterium]
ERSFQMTRYRRVWQTAALVLSVGVAACRGDSAGQEPSGNGADATVIVTPDNVAIVEVTKIESGPTLSGSLQPVREANVRAEVSGSVLQTNAERGERVAAGAVLVRIDDSALRDAFLSARSTVTSATQAVVLAQRNAERAERLLQAGAIPEREAENARLAVTSAESQLTDAKARLALAQQQLSNATARAPFTGVVSEKQVSAGDVVQPGAPLYVIVDPRGMQLEGGVPAADLTSVRVGAPVEFTVSGYPGRTFAGRVTHVSPTADAATGQVTIIASVSNADGTLVGGLFAEGRIGTVSHTSMTAPMAAVDFGGGAPTVMRVEQGVVQRVSVQVGLRDEQAERVELLSGVAPGDTLLLGAAQGITAGTPVRVQALESGGRASGR